MTHPTPEQSQAHIDGWQDISKCPGFVLRDMWIDGSLSSPEYSAEVDRRAKEAARLDDWAKEVTTAISDAIGLGSEMFVRHGEIYRIDPKFVAEYIRERRKDHHEAMHRYVRRIRELEAQVASLPKPPSTTNTPE